MEIRKNPFDLFQKWFLSPENFSLRERTAGILSTIHNDKSRSQVVLIRFSDDDGLIFKPHYHSISAPHVSEGCNASIILYWDFSQKQIFISGRVEKLKEDHCMPVSRKYSVIGWLKRLLNKKERELYRQSFHAYRLIPDHFEFVKWSNFTQRIKYNLINDCWIRSY